MEPKIEPDEHSTKWMEAGPESISKTPGPATLIVRIGMASNALQAQRNAALDASRRKAGMAKTRDILWAFVTSAAFTNEAIRLAKENLGALRSLARKGGAKQGLLDRIGRLCAGKHPAAKVLVSARNKVGFHWDKDLIEPALHEFSTNEMLVWIEAGEDADYVHRLAADVLGHALLPVAAEQRDEPATLRAVQTSMRDVDDAMRLVTEFFVACTFGYLRSCGAKAMKKGKQK